MQFKRFAAAAARLYTDTVTAYRTETEKDANGITREEERPIYSAVPCRLSKVSGDAPDKPATFPVSEQEYALFTPREVRFVANDRVEITRAGELYKGRTARSMVYEVGCETRVSIREVATHD